MPDDDELWSKVTKDIVPLDKRPKTTIPKNTRPQIRQRQDLKPPRLLDQTIIYGGDGGVVKASLAPMNPQEIRRISKGSLEINSTIDLHGETREAAYKRLLSHLLSAQGRGEKLVLVITGRGGVKKPMHEHDPIAHKRAEDFEMETGVLRRALPGWLNGGDMKEIVVSFKTASHKHGGDGAFYIRLRKVK